MIADWRLVPRSLLALVFFSACAAPTVAPAPTAAPRATAVPPPTPELTPTLTPSPGLRLPPTITELAKGFGGPDDLARMPDGSILFSDVGNGTINQIARDGKVVTLLRGLDAPEGIVVLPDGALIVAEQNKNRLLHFRPNSGQPATTWLQLENKTGKPGIDGIARDGATGDIIIPDSPNGRLLRVSADAKSVRVIATGLGRPTGVTIDRDGSLIVADENGNAVLHLRADGRCESLGHFATPDDVAVDAAGNLFVASLGDNSVRVIDALDATTRWVATIQNPQGFVVDADENATQWKIEMDPEANQGALAMLARETLPREWEILKGPSIYREEKRVAVTARGAGDLTRACEQFRATSGYRLSVTLADASATDSVAGAPAIGALEINAALGLIRAQLAGSTLYRASLKGNEIVLSFISPQVGKRHREKIEELARTTGWSLTINPQPNQNAILQIAQELIARAGWVATRGPSIHTDRIEVRVVFAAESEARVPIAAEFGTRTGYRLVIETGVAQTRGERSESSAPTPSAPREEIVEIPLTRIRLTQHHQALELDPAKQRKTLEQLQRLGRVNKPIRARRGATDYLLLDGLYRLRAAQALGWERITAAVEERT